MVRWLDSATAGLLDGWTVQWLDGSTDRWLDGWMA
jgi:hypothetical protein